MRMTPLFLLLLALACGAEPSGVRDITQEEFLSSPPEAVLILDVRTAEEFKSGHIPHAVNIPHDQLASRLGELSREKEAPVVVYCERGRRAGMAADVLAEAGYTDILHLDGDMSEWRAQGLDVEVSN